MAPKFSDGTMVWARVPHYPWWPALVVPFSEYYFFPQHQSPPKHNKKNTTVRFFGDGSLAHLSPAKLVLFGNHQKYSERQGKWAKMIRYAMGMAEKWAKEIPRSNPIIASAVALNVAAQAAPMELNQAPNMGNAGDAPVSVAAPALNLRRSPRRHSSTRNNASVTRVRRMSAPGTPVAVTPIDVGGAVNNTSAGGVMTASQRSSLGVARTPISKSRRSSRGSPTDTTVGRNATQSAADVIPPLRRSKRHSNSSTPPAANGAGAASEQGATSNDGTLGGIIIDAASDDNRRDAGATVGGGHPSRTH